MLLRLLFTDNEDEDNPQICRPTFCLLYSHGVMREDEEKAEWTGHNQALMAAGEGCVSAKEDFMALGNDAGWDLPFFNSIE